MVFNTKAFPINAKCSVTYGLKICPYSSVNLGLHSQVCSISKHKMSVDEGQLVMSDFQGKLTVFEIKDSCLPASVLSQSLTYQKEPSQ